MEVHYGLLLKKSWNDLKNNLIIFLPLLFAIIFTLLFVLLIVLEVFGFIAAGISAETVSVGFIGAAIVVGLLDLLLLIFIGALIGGMYVGLLNAITLKKKAHTSDMWTGMRKFSGLYFKVEMIQISIFLLPLLVLGILVGLVFLASAGAGLFLAFLLGGIYILYAICAAIVVGFGFFFIHPMMSEGRITSALELVKKSLRYTKENLGHVILTWAIVFGINIVVSFANQIVTLPARFAVFSPVLLIISIPFIIIVMVIGIVVTAWLKIFVFNSYFNNKLKKL